jgi:hypothetical protein
MAVLQRILSFIWGILLAVGKLLCLTVRLVMSLFLLVTVGFSNLPCGEQHIRKGIWRKCIGSGTDRIQCHA